MVLTVDIFSPRKALLNAHNTDHHPGSSRINNIMSHPVIPVGLSTGLRYRAVSADYPQTNIHNSVHFALNLTKTHHGKIGLENKENESKARTKGGQNKAVHTLPGVT